MINGLDFLGQTVCQCHLIVLLMYKTNPGDFPNEQIRLCSNKSVITQLNVETDLTHKLSFPDVSLKKTNKQKPFILLIHWILKHSFLSLYSTQFLPPPALYPRSLLLHFPTKKRAGLLGISTKHGLTRCTKPKHKHSYQGWIRQPRRRKSVPSSGKTVRDTPLPLLRGM